MLSCEASLGREAAWGKSPATDNHLAHADEPLLHQDSQVSCGKSAARVAANLSEDRMYFSGKHLLAVLPKKRQEVREGPQDSSSKRGETAGGRTGLVGVGPRMSFHDRSAVS